MMSSAHELVHFLPGRVRVKVPRLTGNASLAGEVERTLTALQGIHHVETSTTTGSGLILSESHLQAALDLEAVGSVMALADTLGPSLEVGDTDTLQHLVHAGLISTADGK